MFDQINATVALEATMLRLYFVAALLTKWETWCGQMLQKVT